MLAVLCLAMAALSRISPENVASCDSRSASIPAAAEGLGVRAAQARLRRQT